MKVTIRRTIASDHTTIIDLFNKCFNKNIVYHDFNNPNDNIIIVAEIEDTIIGMLEIDFIENTIQNTKYAIINNVCVDDKFRHMGIGKLLLNSAEVICKDNKCSYINLTSNKTRSEAHALYKKENYKIIDTCIFRKDLN